MENTLKMFKSINSENLNKLSFEELSRQYCLTHNPQILANAFIRYYDSINRWSAKFFTLNSDDVSSLSVIALDYCLQNYDVNKTKAKFSTYFYSVLYNKFNTEQKSTLYKKRKINYVVETISIQAVEESFKTFTDVSNNHNYDGIDFMINKFDAPLSDEFENELIFVIAINNSDILTDLEKRCCNIMLANNCQCRKYEMAEQLGICRQKYDKVLKSLQTKLKVILQM